MDERCGTCNYCCEVKKFPTYEEVLTHICVFFLLHNEEDYVCETKEYDRCECWKERV